MTRKKEIKATGVIVITTVLAIVWFVATINIPNRPKTSVEFTINRGDSIKTIAINLEKNRLVRSGLAFRIYVTLTKKNLQAGVYLVPADLNIKTLANYFKGGNFDKKLTFLEGWRISEMAEYASKEMIGQADSSFMDKFSYPPLAKEGYLFPDTYFFEKDTPPEKIVETLRENFNHKVMEAVNTKNNTGLTLDEMVNLASIVEKEARTVEDKKTVAGIMIKRYKNNWPLQADATVQYSELYQQIRTSLPPRAEDLKLDTPYNTYLYKGLPPTPICNPGLDSINAVLAPIETGYWFYLTDKNGVTHYSKTMEEQNENIGKYL